MKTLRNRRINDLLLADALFAWAFGIAIIFYGWEAG